MCYMHYLCPSCRSQHYTHSTEVEEVKWPSKHHTARRLIPQPLHLTLSLCCPWKPACPRASLLIDASLVGYPGCHVLQAFRFEKFLSTLWINPFVSCLQVFAHTVPSSSLRVYLRGFPGGSVVKKSACHCRRHRFDHWSGGSHIPWSSWAHMWATTIEPVLEPGSYNYWSQRALEPVLCSEKPPQWEARAQQTESSPRSLKLGKSSHSNRLSTAINK